MQFGSCTNSHKLLCQHCQERLETKYTRPKTVQYLSCDISPHESHSGNYTGLQKAATDLAAARTMIAELQNRLYTIEQTLEAERSNHLSTVKSLLSAEDRIRLQDAPVKHSLKIRRRFMHRFRKGQAAKEATRAGNEAAHDGDVEVDIALFSLGVFDPEEKKWFELSYGFPVDPFLGSHENLMVLPHARRDLESINLRGTTFGPLASAPRLDGKGRLAVAARRFIELEAEYHKIREDLGRRYGTEEEVIQAYEHHQDVNVRAHEMRETARERQRIMQRDIV